MSPTPRDILARPAVTLEDLIALLRERTPMAPWDENAWFDTPKETTFAGQLINKTVAAAEPRRVVLIFRISASINVTVSTVASGTQSQGVLMVSANPEFRLSQKDEPALTSAAWFANSNVGASLTVWEILLRDWPKPKGG